MAHMWKLDDNLQELILYFPCMSRDSGSQARQQAISAIFNNKFNSMVPEYDQAIVCL